MACRIGPLGVLLIWILEGYWAGVEMGCVSRLNHVYILGAGSKSLFNNPPDVLLTSLMHAREPAGLTVLIVDLQGLIK